MHLQFPLSWAHGNEEKGPRCKAASLPSLEQPWRIKSSQSPTWECPLHSKLRAKGRRGVADQQEGGRCLCVSVSVCLGGDPQEGLLLWGQSEPAGSALSWQEAGPLHAATHSTLWNSLHGVRLLTRECQQEGETRV